MECLWNKFNQEISFEFLQKVVLGLMYPFSCVLWAINSRQLMAAFRLED